MAGRTRARGGKPTASDSDEQAAAATAVMALSEKKGTDKAVTGSVKVEDPEAETEESQEEAEAEGEAENDEEEEEEEEEEDASEDAAEDEADASEQQDAARAVQLAAEQNGNTTELPILEGHQGFPQPTVPNPEDLLPTVDSISQPAGSGSEPAVLGLLLPALRSDALSLKNHLSQPCHNSPSWGQVWTILRQAFETVKGPFTTPGASMLNLETLKDSFEDPSTAETANLSVSLANLATVLDILNRNEEDTEDLRVLLETLDKNFPFSIVHASGLSVDWLDNTDYIGMALDIRTQRWMLELDGSDKVDVVNIFKRIFLNPAEEGSKEWNGDIEQLEDANWKEIADFEPNDLSSDENDKMLLNKTFDRVKTVFEFANLQSDPQNALAKFCEVQPFIQELRRFIVKVFEEVDRAYVAKTRQKLPSGGDEYGDELSATQRSGFNEPSRNLYDGFSSLSRFSNLGTSDIHKNRKRRAPESEASAASGAIRKIPQKRQRRSMATPSTQLAQMQAAAAAQQAANPAPMSIVSASAAPMAPPSVGPTSPGGSMITTQTNGDGSGRRKELQKRFFWGQPDTDKLCEYIDRYGCNWARISKEAAFEIPRTQQQLRDKARNLKVDMLRHNKHLNPGFDNVGLHLKEQTLVRKHGKNPHRKEKDVDENGDPINTEWVDGMVDEYETVSQPGVTIVHSQLSSGAGAPIDPSAVTDPSLSQTAASMVNMSAAMNDPNHPVNDPTHPARAAAQQQLVVQLQETPEQIQARVQERFGQMQQATQLSFVSEAAAVAAAATAPPPPAGPVPQDIEMSGTQAPEVSMEANGMM